MITEEIYKRLGEKFRELRMEKGLSQTAIAKQIDVDSSLVSKFEKNGEKLSFDRIVQLFDAVGFQFELTQKKTLLT